METVKTLLESTKENLKMQLWWAEEHDKEPQFIKDIPILKQKIVEIDKALLVLFEQRIEELAAPVNLVEEILEIACELDRGDITFDEAKAKTQNLVRKDNALNGLEQLTIPVVVQSLPKRLSNVAYLNAREMRYEDFISWWDEQV
jgi:Asp-tRNA(Asn)/Glu-tRNA(Gln) amidotransferase C subunit